MNQGNKITTEKMYEGVIQTRLIIQMANALEFEEFLTGLIINLQDPQIEDLRYAMFATTIQLMLPAIKKAASVD